MADKQKIAAFIHCFPPAQGGLEKLAGDTVKKWINEGKKLEVFTGFGRTLDSYKTFSDYVQIYKDSANIHRLQHSFFWQRLANKLFYPLVLKFSFLSPWYFGPILRYKEKDIEIIKKADLIFAFGLPTKMVWDAYQFAKRFNKPLHILPAFHDVSYYKNCLAFHLAFQYAEKIYTLSDFEEKAFIAAYPEVKEKVERFEYWPFSEKKMQDRPKILARLEKIREKRRQRNEINIGFVGQITPRKNIKYFQELLDNIKEYPAYKDKIVKVVLYGLRTNGSAEIEKQLNKGILEDKIEIFYDFKENQKENVYGNIDVFINPSIEESFGIVNLEAKYYGCK